MIFHSIIPLELVMDQNQNSDSNTTKVVQYLGCQVEVSATNGQIQRVLSTIPKDFLNPRLQPGQFIETNN